MQIPQLHRSGKNDISRFSGEQNVFSSFSKLLLLFKTKFVNEKKKKNQNKKDIKNDNRVIYMTISFIGMKKMVDLF